MFYVRPGPAPLTNIGWFGPPIRVGVPYPALSLQPLPVSAVESMQFTYDGLAPEIVTGVVQDTLETDEDIPIAALGLTRVPPLAAMPGLVANLPYVRSSILCADGMDPIQAYAKAPGAGRPGLGQGAHRPGGDRRLPLPDAPRHARASSACAAPATSTTATTA